MTRRQVTNETEKDFTKLPEKRQREPFLIPKALLRYFSWKRAACYATKEISAFRVMIAYRVQDGVLGRFPRLITVTSRFPRTVSQISAAQTNGCGFIKAHVVSKLPVLNLWNACPAGRNGCGSSSRSRPVSSYLSCIRWTSTSLGCGSSSMSKPGLKPFNLHSLNVCAAETNGYESLSKSRQRPRRFPSRPTCIRETTFWHH